MKYIVASTAVTDEITFADGKTLDNTGGGAGWYAYSGMRLWSDQVLLVSGVGVDFLHLHNEWFERNHADTSGLIPKTDHSPVTKIQYHNDGERTEVPIYGLEHYNVINPTPEDLKPFCMDCKGMYIFKNVDDLDFWEKIFALKKQYGFKLMWEIAADAAVSEKKDIVLEILRKIDVLSINRSEVINLFGLEESNIVDTLNGLNIPMVFYRRGEQGSSIIVNGQVTDIQSVLVSDAIDPTGAGNSSSGAVLVGYCEEKEAAHIGLMGNISAAYSISQYGPIPTIDENLKGEARQLLDSKLKAYDVKGMKDDKRI